MDGEWSNFNAVCVNEESDFIAQLFSNSNPNHNPHHHHHHHHLDLNYNANHPSLNSYYSSDQNDPHNMYYNYSQESNYSSLLNEEHHQDHQGQGSSLPIDFLSSDQLEGDDGLNIEITLDPVAEDKDSDSSDNCSKKRPRLSHGRKGKRNVRGKKNEKKMEKLEEEEEEEEMEEENEGSVITEGTISKTRASRGSATDPQSLYARKRRERINERLKILQTLVPNGTKVDISTMLEEAVQYVKFLQLQIKLLSSDELWMYAPLAYNGMNIGLDFNLLNFPK